MAGQERGGRQNGSSASGQASDVSSEVRKKQRVRIGKERVDVNAVASGGQQNGKMKKDAAAGRQNGIAGRHTFLNLHGRDGSIRGSGKIGSRSGFGTAAEQQAEKDAC